MLSPCPRSRTNQVNYSFPVLTPPACLLSIPYKMCTGHIYEEISKLVHEKIKYPCHVINVLIELYNIPVIYQYQQV